MKFIYVFDAQNKEKLEALGYTLLKEDADSSVYIFESNSSLKFGLDDVDFIYSDTLTF